MIIVKLRLATNNRMSAFDAVDELKRLMAPVATVGSFSMTCLTAATFQIDPPANDPMPLTE